MRAVRAERTAFHSEAINFPLEKFRLQAPDYLISMINSWMLNNAVSKTRLKIPELYMSFVSPENKQYISTV